MRIDIITIFPEMFSGVFSSGIIRIAQEKRLLQIHLHNLRDFTQDRHKKVDAPPYGGGPGMVLRCEPIFNAVETIKRCSQTSSSTANSSLGESSKTILLSPQGRLLTQKFASKLAKYQQLILICGRYEGVDERVVRYLIDEEISIGDYILSGGEIPAMVLVDVLARLIPQVVGDKDSVKKESFEEGLLDWPHYTRPRVFRGLRVPPVLLSGDHKKIEIWRKKQALRKTKGKRPDLLKKLKGKV